MELDEIRREIDLVDTQMRELFLKRMELSGQVIAAKKRTDGAVYVPQRETEIIENHSKGVEEEKQSEYRMFIKQIMNISRTYQYSKIVETAEEIAQIPTGEGEICLRVFCRAGSNHLFFMLDALVLAGLSIEKIEAIEQTGEGTAYCIQISGDFADELSRGAVLQIFRELEQVEFA